MSNVKLPLTVLVSRQLQYAYLISSHFKHASTQVIYQIVDVSIRESDNEPLITYMAVTGEAAKHQFRALRFNRPASEFFDGRFIPVCQPTVA